MQQPKVIAIVGPTASGKSALGAFLATKFGGEIVSADSRQIYKGMSVISRADPGHMVAVKSPQTIYSSGQYVKDASKIVANIFKRRKIPIVVGGAGYYADALLRGLTLPQVAPNKKLRAMLAKKTPSQLMAILKKLDPKSAKRVDPKNIVRLVRAIEIAKSIGSVPDLASISSYDVLWLGLGPAAMLHAKAIQKGVEKRFDAGMLREAKKLRSALSQKRYESLGFEFTLLAQYIDKKISKKALVEALVRGEQNYAKRQMRWFKRNSDIHWIQNKTAAFRLAREFVNY